MYAGVGFQQPFYGGGEVITTTSVVEYGAPAMGWSAYSQPRKVALRAIGSGKFLVAEHSTLFAHHNDHGGKGHFHIKHLHSNVVELVTHHGKYVGL